MVRKFEVGCVYNAPSLRSAGLQFRNESATPGWLEPVKVTRISARTVWWFRRTCSTTHTRRAKIQGKEYDDEYEYAFFKPCSAGPIKEGSVTLDSGKLHYLHPFFPSKTHEDVPGALAFHK